MIENINRTGFKRKQKLFSFSENQKLLIFILKTTFNEKNAVFTNFDYLDNQEFSHLNIPVSHSVCLSRPIMAMSMFGMAVLIAASIGAIGICFRKV